MSQPPSWDPARTARLPPATSAGTCLSPSTVTAHAAMPEAWTRAGPSELTYCPVELLDGTFLVPKARGGLHV